MTIAPSLRETVDCGPPNAGGSASHQRDPFLETVCHLLPLAEFQHPQRSTSHRRQSTPTVRGLMGHGHSSAGRLARSATAKNDQRPD